MTEAKTHLSGIDDETDHDDGGEGLMTLAPSIALLNADGSRDH